MSDNLQERYHLHFWRNAKGSEVDFVLYGPRALIAIEVKRTGRVRPRDCPG